MFRFRPTRPSLRRRSWLATLSVTAALAVIGVAAGPANAAYQDVNNWTIYEGQVNTGLHGLFANVSAQYYRWITNMPHSSRVSNNLCSNYNLYYVDDFAAHDTSYHQTGWFSPGQCFAIRGRSLYGTQVGDGREQF